MYIQKVSIRNFRIFDHEGVSFIFNKGINAVIGENNNGKTALIDAIRIAFSCNTYKKDIFFNKNDFHVNAAGEIATTAQIDIYLKEVPQNLIDIWDPLNPDSGEFHVVFTLEKTTTGTEKVKSRAWGGVCEGNPLSSDTLEAINVAYLGALRDAANELKPSRNSKLANLLGSIASQQEQKDELVEKLRMANHEMLEMEPLTKTKKVLNDNLYSIEQKLLHQRINIGFVEPKFDSILSSLRSWIMPRWLFMDICNPDYSLIKELGETEDYKASIHLHDDGLYVDVDAVVKDERLDPTIKAALLKLENHSFEVFQNGLGYNNLLFIAAVLGDMAIDKAGIYENLFLVEEPEAHLHPQLQELILSFFYQKIEELDSIQVIMTSHSPTLVSKIRINHINLLYENKHRTNNYALVTADLSEEESDYLEKFLDVTKSQLFFAKGVIFVEGISEAILIPEFAKLIERPLDMYAVEVVNINGVGFEPFAKMMKIPDCEYSFAKSSIVTDDDRCSTKLNGSTYISKDLDFNDDLTGIAQKINIGSPSDRFISIISLCEKYESKCFGAVKTFEYELALEKNNVSYILEAIISSFPIIGKELKAKVDAESDQSNKALLIWLFIRSRNSAKAKVAQALGRLLQQQIQARKNGETVVSPFIIPKYIKDAIYNVTEDEYPNGDGI